MSERGGIGQDADTRPASRLRWVPKAVVWLLTVTGLGAALLAWARPEQATAEGFLYANGRVEAVSVRVSAETTGQVTESFLVEGTRVAAGEVLVRLDDAELRIAHAESRSESMALERGLERVDQQLSAWRRRLAIATTELERARALNLAGVASDSVRDEAEESHAGAEGHVRALEAERREIEARIEASRHRSERLQLRREKSTVTAPISGTVLVRAIEAGELATPGRFVAELANLEELELRVFVSERDVGKVRTGSEARVRVDAFPERAMPARVARVDQQAQFTPREVHVPEERVRLVFGVTLAVPNPDGVLKPGMPADTWIRWREEVSWPERLIPPR